jgi:protein-L-isoaspartate O-methyltransferase
VVGGRLIIPVGKAMQQRLLIVTRTETGFEEQELSGVSFVPMLKGQV